MVSESEYSNSGRERVLRLPSRGIRTSAAVGDLAHVTADSAPGLGWTVPGNSGSSCNDGGQSLRCASRGRVRKSDFEKQNSSFFFRASDYSTAVEDSTL